MPKINWEEISEFKHQLSQERTILCGVLLALKKGEELDKPKFINRLEMLDKRLEVFENNLVDLIMKHIEENNNERNHTPMGATN